jgi:uncharacterized protein YcgI (DUF1989 family)
VFKKTMFAAAALLAANLSLASLSPVSAGAIGGPKTTGWQTVEAEGADTYHISFRGNALAIIRARGQGDIDLYVYDSDGRLVARDAAYDSTPVCVFTPHYSETYTVRVVNAEEDDVDYVLETN